MSGPGFVDPIHSWWDRTRTEVEAAGALLRRSRWISRARVLVVAFAAGMAFVLRTDWSRWWLLLFPAACFVALAIVHERVLRQALRRRHVAELYHRAAERVDRDGEEAEADARPAEVLRTGEAPARRRTPREEERLADRIRRVRRLGDLRLDPHLDLFGIGQLFDRLADWRTDAGGEVLARWLLHPAAPDEARARQEAVRELIPRSDLRDVVAETGGLMPWPLADFAVVPSWLGAPAEGPDGADDRAEAPPFPRPRPERIRPWLTPGFAVLTGAMVAGLLAWLGFGLSPLFFVIPVWVSVGVGLWNRERVRRHERTIAQVAREVEPTLEIACLLQAGEFEAPLLKSLRDRLAEAPPALRSLRRLRNTMALRRNPMFAPIAASLFWGSHYERAIDRWRDRHRDALRDWRRAAGEFDALLALAQYAAERPGHVFAEFDDVPGLVAVHLGHPLIPEGRLQRNSVRLGGGGPDVLIVTGSNMAGKSTFLRAIGANYLLARMGAPVAASRFRLGPLALGVSISVHDSLEDGVSRFLAELLALRGVLSTGSPEEPLLFLLDEVLGGTNPNDRRLAARALLAELGRRGAVGVLTTHDLALAELEHELPGRVENRHFRERIANGRMEFDYQLRDGVLPQGNALDLMRMLRLPAPEVESGEFTSLPGERPEREH